MNGLRVVLKRASAFAEADSLTQKLVCRRAIRDAISPLIRRTQTVCRVLCGVASKESDE